MAKKVIVTVDFVCHCYNVSVGVKGDTGDPGVRGPRGLTGIQYAAYVGTYI